MRRFLILSILIIFYWSNQFLFAQEDTYSSMQQGFLTPPLKAHPNVYHWWLGGNVDTLRLKEEIVALKNAGIAGFTIFEIGSRDTVLVKSGPAFLSDQSLEVIKCAVDQAGELGMEVGLNTASSWNAGGNWLPPKYAAKSIYYAEKIIQGGKQTEVKLPFPEIPKKDPWGKPRLIEFEKDGKPVFYQEIAVLAIPAVNSEDGLDTSQIINVSEYFDPQSEELKWKAPAGKWNIFRYVCSNSGENLVLPSKHSAGPIVDHYDAEATEFHFMYIINKLQSVLGDFENTALKSLYMASYEAKGFTWTTTLPEVFRRINGYEVDKFLPILFNEDAFSSELRAHFKADFQRTLSELMITNFYQRSKQVCNRYGLKNNSEAGGPGLPLHNVPVEPIRALGSGLDIPRGEFWINHGRFNEDGIDILRVVKEVASASHIYNLGIVEMEAFTTFQHWQEGPFDMKPVGDRAFCEGMNKVVVHGSTHNPSGTGFPGIVYHAGTHYNDKRVWWPKIKPFNDYLARISYILQEADFQADILFCYGDTIPNYGGHKNSRFTAGPGYEYEIINTDILLKLKVKNNKLIIPETGAEFSMIALSNEYEINPEVIIKLKELMKEGAVIIGEKPNRVITRRMQSKMPEAKRLLNELWEDGTSKTDQPTGTKILSGISPSIMLKRLGLKKDISYLDEELHTLDYTHYSKDDLEFYFIRNTTGGWVSREVEFRQPNKAPEIWDPVSGEIIPVPLFTPASNYTAFPLTLAPYGSTFVVFRETNRKPRFDQLIFDDQHPPQLQYVKEGICFWEEGLFELRGINHAENPNIEMAVTTLEGPWEVFFPPGWGAPKKVIFPKLKSWTTSENEGIKYFSGIARYEKSFVHSYNANSLENPKIFLDLGDLSHVGEVWLNDEPLGITWTKPYRFDVTKVIKPGPNKLVIEVANTWSNRLTGDAITGQSYTSTNITSTDVNNGYFIRAPWEEVPLIESGLFGPITLTVIKPLNTGN
tara:strand:- start:47843 stop:50803 length:2961 start_codon:yes stop_codon:yes gene_type:complete